MSKTVDATLLELLGLPKDCIEEKNLVTIKRQQVKRIVVDAKAALLKLAIDGLPKKSKLTIFDYESNLRCNLYNECLDQCIQSLKSTFGGG